MAMSIQSFLFSLYIIRKHFFYILDIVYFLVVIFLLILGICTFGISTSQFMCKQLILKMLVCICPANIYIICFLVSEMITSASFLIFLQNFLEISKLSLNAFLDYIEDMFSGY